MDIRNILLGEDFSADLLLRITEELGIENIKNANGLKELVNVYLSSFDKKEDKTSYRTL